MTARDIFARAWAAPTARGLDLSMWSKSFQARLDNEGHVEQACAAVESMSGARCTLAERHALIRHVDETDPGVLVTWAVAELPVRG